MASWQRLLTRGRGDDGSPGPIKPTLANTIAILKNDDAWSDVLAFPMSFSGDVITRKVPRWGANVLVKGAKPGPWTDLDTNRLVEWFERSQYHRRSSRPIRPTAP